MKEIPNADRFPFHIKQTQDHFCIPASIEAVTKYFVPGSPVTQDYLWSAFVLACARRSMSPRNISFKSIKELVIDTDAHYSWAESRHIDRPELRSFKELADLVRGSIDSGLPHIISVPVRHFGASRTLWHMLTAIGYDDSNLRIYDPNPEKERPYDLPLAKLQSDLKVLANADVTDSFVLRPKAKAANPPQVTNEESAN
jgi:hypothetical protein